MSVLFESYLDTMQFTYSYVNKNQLYVYCTECKAFHLADYIVRAAFAKQSYYFNELRIFHEHEDFNLFAEAFEKKPPLKDITYPRTQSNYNIKKRYDIDETQELKYLTNEEAIETRNKEFNSAYPSNRKGLYNRYIVKDYVCSNCKKAYPSELMLCKDMESKSSSKFDSVCYGATVYEEDNAKGQKLLKANICFLEYSTFGGNIQLSKSRIKLVSNIHTGQTYIVGVKRIAGTQRTYHSNKLSNVSLKWNKELLNNNFFGSKQVFDALQIMYKRIYQEKTLLLGHEPDAFKENVIATPFLIARLNRHPNANHELIDKNSCLNNYHYGSRIKNNNNPIRAYKHTSDDFATHMLNVMKLPCTKQLKKFLRNLDIDIFTLKALFDNYKDINNIYKIIKAKKTNIIHPENSIFIQDCIDYCGETATINKVVNDTHYLNDTAYQYRVLKKKLNSEANTNVIDLNLNGTIKEIHDRLSVQYLKIRNQNYELAYEQEELELEIHNHPRYLLRFAKDTHELLGVGTALRICVGSYGKRARNRDVNIALVIDKEDSKVVGCIELNSQFTEVRQAKGYANYRMEDGPYEFTVEWMNKNNLMNGNPYDILKEGKEDLLHETHSSRMTKNVVAV